MSVAWLWRFLVLAAGVTGLSLGWVSNAGPLGPLVFFTDQSNIAVAAYMAPRPPGASRSHLAMREPVSHPSREPRAHGNRRRGRIPSKPLDS